MKMRLFWFILPLWVTTHCFADSKEAGAVTSSSEPVEIATEFMRYLEQGKVDEALNLWTNRSKNDRLKERIEKMSDKTIQFGGIEKLKTPKVEERPENIKNHEVVVVVIYGKGDLGFGSFSFQKENDEFKISDLRSEKGWGGTTSLFEKSQE